MKARNKGACESRIELGWVVGGVGGYMFGWAGPAVLKGGGLVAFVAWGYDAFNSCSVFMFSLRL